MQIQEHLIATIQNIEVLLRYGEPPKKSVLAKVNQVKGVMRGGIQPIFGIIKDFMLTENNGITSLDLVCVGFNKIQKPSLFKRGI